MDCGLFFLSCFVFYIVEWGHFTKNGFSVFAKRPKDEARSTRHEYETRNSSYDNLESGTGFCNSILTTLYSILIVTITENPEPRTGPYSGFIREGRTITDLTVNFRLNIDHLASASVSSTFIPASMAILWVS